MHIALFTDHDPRPAGGFATTFDALVRHLPNDMQITLHGGKAGIASGLRAYDLLTRSRRERVDVVHVAASGPVAIAAILVAARLKVPVISSPEVDRAAASLTRWAQLRALSRPCCRLFASSLIARDKLAKAGIAPGKVVTWRPGVDTTLFSPARRSAALREHWQVSDTRPAIIYVGHLSDESGAHRLVSLDMTLRRQHPMHRLIVVGGGPRRDELRARCSEAAIIGEVEHSHVPELLASADLFVSPSEGSSTHHAVLEAQASGVPVVVMEDGSACERICESSGIVCRSEADLIVETAALVRTDSRRKLMAKAARDHALGQLWDDGLAPLYGGYRLAAALSAARRDLSPALASQSRRL